LAVGETRNRGAATTEPHQGVGYFTAPTDGRKVETRPVSGTLNHQELAIWTEPMGKEFSKYQQKVIKNYYDNRDAISLQRLSELVTDLYLAEGKSRLTKWNQVISTLEKCGIAADRIEHLRKKDDPALVAKVVEELMAKE
jgi:hypothetical protein